MRAEQLVKHAIELSDFLKSTGHPEVTCKHIPSVGLFIDVYQSKLPRGAGVYLFHFDDGEVFYVGKTDTRQGNFTKRVWDHFCSAPKSLDSGERGFPNCEFLPLFGIGSIESAAIHAGHVRVDCVVVTPTCLTSLFEVYLHTVCALSEEGLPKCNRQIG